VTCPPDVARVILQILQVAVLRIRAVGWGGDGSCCAEEADHVHNLPALLIDYSDDLLRFYWEVERPSFMKLGRPTSRAMNPSGRSWRNSYPTAPAQGPLEWRGREQSRERGGAAGVSLAEVIPARTTRCSGRWGHLGTSEFAASRPNARELTRSAEKK
jgi:hypothetical protein